MSVFDYGCGHGADIHHLREKGIECSGWDPVHRSFEPIHEADVVNLGYVVNVIESASERATTLNRAWSLARRTLVISARLGHERRLLGGQECEDGVLTARGTFQKFFEQHELHTWIQETLDVEAVAAAPGIFLVFRSPTERETFVASRFRHRVAQPHIRVSEALFREHEAVLAPLISFMEERGRPPTAGELAAADILIAIFGSLRQAASILQRVFGADHWSQTAAGRRKDLLVYLALSKFGGRQRASDLPLATRNDVKYHCGSYTRACEEADRLLYSAASRPALEEAMCEATTGKLTPGAFYIHSDWAAGLSPVLRVYEGCARALVGDVPNTNIIKLSREKFRVSYLSYPDFGRDPHPSLDHSVVVKLQALDVRYRSFDDSPNPPILHRKDTLVDQSDLCYEKYRRLTEQEDRWDLLDDSSEIGTRDGWNRRLKERGFRLSGHRLVRDRRM